MQMYDPKPNQPEEFFENAQDIINEEEYEESIYIESKESKIEQRQNKIEQQPNKTDVAKPKPPQTQKVEQRPINSASSFSTVKSDVRKENIARKPIENGKKEEIRKT